MAFCTKCGANLPSTAAFCQQCGTPQAVGATTAPGAATLPPPPVAAQSGLSENAAATLSYVLGWFTGIIFFLIDKRPYVRFHAAQSIVTFGGLHAIRIVLGITFGVGWWFGSMRAPGFLFALPILSLLGLFSFVLWIYCMVKANQGVRFKLPIAGDAAESLAGRY